MSSVALHRGPAGCENSRHALKQRRCAYYERVITRRSRVSIFKAGPHTHTRIIINTMCVYGGSHRGKKAFGIQTAARTRQIYFIKKNKQTLSYTRARGRCAHRYWRFIQALFFSFYFRVVFLRAYASTGEYFLFFVCTHVRGVVKKKKKIPFAP